MHGLLLADTPADPSSTSSWAAIVIALLTIIYIVFIRPSRKKRDRDPLARQPNQTLLSQQRSIERDMTALLVEYEQMMRTMSAQIDMRTTKLELLLRDADEKIKSLKAAAETPAARTVTTTSAVAVPAEATTSPAEPKPHAELPIAAPMTEKKVPASAVAPAATSHSATLLKRVRDLQEEAGVGLGMSSSADGDDPHAEIYALADEGLSYRQIAHKLDRAYGEIELILALRPKSNATPTEKLSPARVEVEQVAEPRRGKHRRKQHT